MRRRGIEVVVALLYVLAVIAFGAAQSEETLLENRVNSVPQLNGKAEPAFAIADAKQAIFAPAIGAASRVIVWKICPHIAIRRVVFSNRSPLPLGQIWAPPLPVLFAPRVLLEAALLGGDRAV